MVAAGLSHGAAGEAWIYLIMQLVGASLLVTTITGVPYRYMVWVVRFVFIAYTVLGGLISVAWTDLMQGSVMVVTVFGALAYMALDLGGVPAFNQQLQAIDAAHVAPLGAGAYTVLGVIGSIVSFFGTIFTSQSNIIRINATRDIRTAKLHIAAAGTILSVFMVALTLLGGATTVALHRANIAIQTGDRAFPVLITQYLPTTVGAAIILAAMSAILSTTDTRLHATGVTTARDIYDYFADDPSDEQMLRVSRYATVFFGGTATLAAVNPPAAIISLYSFRAVLLTSAFLLPVYAALYWRGLDGRAIIASVIAGAVVGVVAQLLPDLLPLPATILGVGVAALVLGAGHLWWDEWALAGTASG